MSNPLEERFGGFRVWNRGRFERLGLGTMLEN